MSSLLVLDFEGTLTDEEAGTETFRQSYYESLASITGWPIDHVRERAAAWEAHIMSGGYGWVYDGHIVAPAAVDPYLRIKPVARMILEEAGVLPTEETLQVLFESLYQTNYPNSTTSFRPEAVDLLAALEHGEVETFVVTNSDERPVQAKILRLHAEHGGQPWLGTRVYGAARKYIIDSSLEHVPQFLRLKGLDRPVLLRRGNYLRVLNNLRTGLGLPWNDVHVVGDIFELDLALPLALGAHVALLANEWTPEYERTFLSAHPRGQVLNNLDEVMPWLQS